MNPQQHGTLDQGAGSPAQKRRLSFVDRLSMGLMIFASIAMLIMTVFVCYEVGSRYLLGRPTIWAWDLNVQLMFAMVMLGMAEVYRQDAFVRVDAFTSMLSPRSRIWLDVIFAPLIILIAAIILYTGWHYFQTSYSRNQLASTTFAPPLWPVKFMLPLGAAMLLLQAIQKLFRDIGKLRAPVPAEPSEAK